MVKLDFLIPRDYHIEEIARNIRKGDRMELLASGRNKVHESLIDSVTKSKTCVVACLKDKPLVIYGMQESNILSNTAMIWMVGVEDSLKYPREFMVYTRRVLDEMFLEFSTLMNFVHSENKVSIKWLEALGFTICEAQPMGVKKQMFHYFYKNRSN